ncbi:MAG: type II toxin-antitoxin system VapC family toxin [Terracidiphilus sp.]|jgi:tRNA(fMet)-specific endonuclease VapC
MALRYLLDTNTVSYLLSGKPPAVREHLSRAGLAATAISTITEAEMRYGLANKPPSMTRRNAVETFLANATILASDSAAARAYGLLRAEQQRKGRPLSAEDLMIAAQALALGMILVTHDQVFSFVDGLKIEDWTIA